jgi:signal transduction histidine kinase
MLLLRKADPNIVYTYSLKTGKLTSLYPLLQKILSKNDLLSGDPFFYRKENIVYTNVANNVVAVDISSPGNIRASLVHSFANETPTYAFIDRKGTFWIGTKNGVYYIENGNTRMVALPEMIQVKTMNEDTKGNIWVGTLEGIYVIGANKKFKLRYNEKNGLSNGFIYGILRDGDDMWFSHNKGLSVYNTATNKFRHYTKEDGLQSNEFNTGAYFKAEDGTLFFGGINGTNGFRPEEIKDNPHVPKVVITNIKLFDKDLKTDVAYWNLREVALPYKQNSLTFEFSGLEFTNSAQNQYAYIMEGLDEKWNYSGKTRFARYPALPPGTYYFKVKASNNDGIWQETPTVVKVVIVPPFWQTWWFRTLCVLLLIVVITVILNSIQKQRNRAQLRAIELQQKIQMERERISRDLHDNVGTQLSLISNNIEWVEHPLKALSEQEKLEKLHYVNTMARDIIATLRETIWALNKEQISLEEFSDKLKAFVHKQMAMYPQIALKFSERFVGELTLGPSEALNLFRICQEAIANALKYAGAVELTIDIANTEDKYEATITDNGRGFDVNSVDPLVQNGLENMKYRSADIGCELAINSIIGKGTTIVITKK